MKRAVPVPYLAHDKPQADVLLLVKFLDSSPIVFDVRVLGNLTTANIKYRTDNKQIPRTLAMDKHALL
jgi:hypothetical protein